MQLNVAKGSDIFVEFHIPVLDKVFLIRSCNGLFLGKIILDFKLFWTGWAVYCLEIFLLLMIRLDILSKYFEIIVKLTAGFQKNKAVCQKI